MGLAASQARLISLQARMSDLEYEGQQINQQRQVLTNKMSEVYNQAMNMEVPVAPSKIDFRTDAYSGKLAGQTVNVKRLENGKWKGSITQNAYTCAGFSKVSLSEQGGKIQFKTGDKISEALLDILEETDPTKANSFEKDADGVYRAKQDVTITRQGIGSTSAALVTVDEFRGLAESGVDGFENAALSNTLKGLMNTFGDSFDEAKVKLYVDPTDGSIKAIYDNEKDSDGYYARSTKYGETSVNVSEIEPQFDANGNIEAVKFKDNNGEYQTINVNSSADSFDEDGYDAAMREYDRKKIQYDVEQNEFNKQTSIYQRQDKQLELKLTRLDNERNALNTEIESVKKVIQDATEGGFKTFSG